MSISSIGSSGYAGAYSGLTASANPLPGTGESSARDEFDKFQAMTPAQKMRAMMLAQLGVTEDQLKAMPADKRKAIEDKIKEMIKQQVQHDPDKKNGQKGLVADIMA